MERLALSQVSFLIIIPPSQPALWHSQRVGVSNGLYMAFVITTLALSPPIRPSSSEKRGPSISIAS